MLSKNYKYYSPDFGGGDYKGKEIDSRWTNIVTMWINTKQYKIQLPPAELYGSIEGLYAYLKGRKVGNAINAHHLYAFTANDTTDFLTFTYAGDNYFDNGATIRLTTTGTLPAGLSTGTTYYVINATRTTCQLSATRGGSAINITSTGSGTHTSQRYNGLSIGDLIENPAYVLESIIKEEGYVERDLIIDAVNSTTSFDVDGLKFATTDYYYLAQIVNVTRDEADYITAYDATNKRITIGSAKATWSVNDNIYIYSIKGFHNFDITSFDIVGNTTDGKRKNWLFARSVNEVTGLNSLVNELLFESNCTLFRSYNKHKLIALDEETGSVDTWTNPLKQGSSELFSATLTPLANIYTDYRIKYHYEYAKGSFIKEVFVNKNGSTSGAVDLSSVGLSSQETLCGDAELNYKTIRKFEYGCRWIYDAQTACTFLKKLIAWFMKQRLIVRWGGDCKTYIKYELGDQVKLNYSKLIPSGLNNSAKFMIFNKTIYPENPPYVVFDLIQMS